MSSNKPYRILRIIILALMLFVALLVFVFALVSGAEKGLEGIVRNSPNALPWFVLVLSVFVAWKWELPGGILILVLGLIGFVFFNMGPNFFWITFIVTLIPLVAGVLLLAIYFLGKNKNK